MRLFKTLSIALLCLVVVFVGVLFSLHNTDEVVIDLIFVQLPAASLSLTLISTFTLGAVLGVSLSSFMIFALKTRLGSAKRKIQNTQKELDKLRVSSLKDVV